MFGANPSGWFGTDHFWLGDAKYMDYSLRRDGEHRTDAVAQKSVAGWLAPRRSHISVPTAKACAECSTLPMC